MNMMRNFRFVVPNAIERIFNHFDEIKIPQPKSSDEGDFMVVMSTARRSGSDHIYNSSFKMDDVFPISQHIFEGYKFPVPADMKAVLSVRYGPNYNDLPNSFGYSHHLGSW